MTSSSHQFAPFRPLHDAPASFEEIRCLENLALGLLDPIPPEVHRRYDVGGEIGALSLGTIGFEECQTIPPVAFVSLLDSDGEALMQLVFSPEDEVRGPNLVPNSLSRVTAIARDLLDAGFEDPRHAAITRSMHSLALDYLYEPGAASPFAEPSPFGEARPVSEVIRELVGEQVVNALHAKDWKHAFDLSNVLRITQNRMDIVEGDLEDFLESMEEISLQVQLETKRVPLNYTFTKTFEGEVSLHVYNPDEIPKDDDEEGIERYNAAHEILDNQGAFRPTKLGVKKISDRLCEALSVENDVPTDLSALQD